MRDDAIGAPTVIDDIRAAYTEIVEGAVRTGARGNILFCVSSDDLAEGKGDLYVAGGLARALQQDGWGVSLWTIDRMAEQTPADIDVAVVMIESWVPGFIHPASKLVAWVRNWTDDWASLPYLEEFAEIWCSSGDSAAAISTVFSGPVRVVPLATDPQLFAPGDGERSPSVVTTANYWGVARAVQPALERVATEFPVTWFGVNSAFLQLTGGIDHRDAIDYFELPGVYGRSAIVVDDLIGAAALYGNQNSRLFDALASGAVVVTNAARGLDELGLTDVPVYDTPDELLGIVRGILGDPEAAAATAARLGALVREHHTWGARARMLREPLEALVAREGASERSAMLVWATELREKMRRDRRAHDDYSAMYYGAAREAERLNGELQHLRALHEQRRYRVADSVMGPVTAVRRRLRPPGA